jgi:hypothetical protein
MLYSSVPSQNPWLDSEDLTKEEYGADDEGKVYYEALYLFGGVKEVNYMIAYGADFNEGRARAAGLSSYRNRAEQR